MKLFTSILAGYNQSASTMSVCPQASVPGGAVATRGSASAAGRQTILFVKRTLQWNVSVDVPHTIYVDEVYKQWDIWHLLVSE